MGLQHGTSGGREPPDAGNILPFPQRGAGASHGAPGRETPRRRAPAPPRFILKEGPRAAQLVAWLCGFPEAGLTAVFWNAARLPLSTAIARAQRLPEDALLEVRGDHVLVVEPLRRPAGLAPAADEVESELDGAGFLLP